MFYFIYIKSLFLGFVRASSSSLLTCLFSSIFYRSSSTWDYHFVLVSLIFVGLNWKKEKENLLLCKSSIFNIFHNLVE